MLLNCSGDVFCNDVLLEQVELLTYLGLVIEASAEAPIAMLQDRLHKSKFAFCKLKSKSKLLGLHNCHVRVQLVQSLAVSQLLFGCIVWGCLAPLEITLSHCGNSAHAKLWIDCETHLRNMLRWAMMCKRDIRTSLLYISSNCPTAQVLALKRMFRYSCGLDKNPRLITTIRENILPAERSLYGPNFFSYWQ